MELKEGKWCREGTVDQINRTEIDPVRKKKKKKKATGWWGLGDFSFSMVD